MIVTTGYIDHRDIKEYCGIVTANLVEGLNFARDFFASIKDFTGGRIEGYEKMLGRGEDEAFSQLAQNASQVGADAVMGVRFNLGIFSPHEKGTVIGVSVYGTAVKLKQGNAAIKNPDGESYDSQPDNASRKEFVAPVNGIGFEWGK